MPKILKSLSELRGIVRTADDGLAATISDLTGVDCSVEPSLTQQQFANDCDINQIVARYIATDTINLRSDMNTGRYADLCNMPDYQQACNIVIQANAAFEALPAELRKRFDNNPAYFLDFVSDPKNADRLGELGLLEPKASPVGEPSTGAGASQPRQAPVGGSGQPDAAATNTAS